MERLLKSYPSLPYKTACPSEWQSRINDVLLRCYGILETRSAREIRDRLDDFDELREAYAGLESHRYISQVREGLHMGVSPEWLDLPSPEEWDGYAKNMCPEPDYRVEYGSDGNIRLMECEWERVADIDWELHLDSLTYLELLLWLGLRPSLIEGMDSACFVNGIFACDAADATSNDHMEKLNNEIERYTNLRRDNPSFFTDSEYFAIAAMEQADKVISTFEHTLTNGYSFGEEEYSCLMDVIETSSYAISLHQRILLHYQYQQEQADAIQSALRKAISDRSSKAAKARHEPARRTKLYAIELYKERSFKNPLQAAQMIANQVIEYGRSVGHCFTSEYQATNTIYKWLLNKNK